MDKTIALSTLNGFQDELNRYPAGATVEAYVGVDKDLSGQDLYRLQQELVAGGLQLTAPVEIGTGEWANTVRLQFINPPVTPGVGVLPLVVLIILAAGVVGVGALLGWKIGNIFDSVSTSLLPLAIVAGAVLVVVTIAKRPSRT